MNNCGKGGRASYATIEKQMTAFDNLPRSVRLALANGYQNWAAFPIHRQWQRGAYPDAKALIKAIRAWDAKQRQHDRQTLADALSTQPKRRTSR